MIFRLFVVFMFCHVALATFETVSLVKNAYQGIVIAINPEIAENRTLIDAIQSAWTAASAALYIATRKRAYFGNITILVPKSWNGNYERAIDESYNEADVVVTNTNGIHGNSPYVVQPGGCGDPGTQIHMTREYYTNNTYVESYGPRGKVIVHEWSHLRWGVFDEIASGDYPPFYISSAGTIEATRCSLRIQGENMIVRDNEIVDYSCNYDDQTLLPNSTDCKYVLAWDQDLELKASLMSYQYVTEIDGFCHDDDADPINRHNPEAPNEQNDKCNKRSVWDVITSSNDFAGGLNLPNPAVASTTPTFKVVKPYPFRSFVLVLDVSGSMAGSRLVQMRQIIRSFIDDFVPIGDYVGMAAFSTIARRLAQLGKIRDQSDKEALLRKIPRSVRGLTCIGCGINTAIRIMEEHSPNACGHIIVFTDGEENVDPRVADVHDKVVKKKCKVSAVFFTTNGNTDLVNLVTATSGTWFFGDTNDITPIIGAYEQIAKGTDGDLSQQTNRIHSSSRIVEAGEQFFTDVDIDATIGNQTVFSFAWSEGGDTPLSFNLPLPHLPYLGISITSPSGCSYSTIDIVPGNPCASHPLANVNAAFKTIRFSIPGIAKEGKWRYQVTSKNRQTVTATVTSKLRAKQKPIVVTVSTIPYNRIKSEPMKIFARVSVGGTPLTGAHVTAIIIHPNKTKQHLQLFDGGANPDATKNDGIYSRYFFESSIRGRYSLEVLASGSPGERKSENIHFGKSAAYKVGYVHTNGTVILNKNPDETAGDAAEVVDTTDIGSFTRIVTSQSFSSVGLVTDPDVDVNPPGTITDLKVQQTVASNVTSPLLVTFTAPGDDFDSGTASSYEIRYTLNNSQNLLTAFDEQTEVSEAELLVSAPIQPKQAGSHESMLVKPPNISHSANLTRVSYSVRTADDGGNLAAPSNIATVNLLTIRPVIPTLLPRTTAPPPTTPVDGKQNIGLCRSMYHRAFVSTYRYACRRQMPTTYNCSPAMSAFYWTKSNYQVECGQLNYKRACTEAYSNACRWRWCSTCRRQQPQRYGLYHTGRRTHYRARG